PHHLHLHSFPTRRSSDLSPTNHIFSGDRSNLEEAFGLSYDKDYLQWWLAFDGNVFSFDDPTVQIETWYCILLERDSLGVISFFRDRKSTRLNSSHSQISY